MDFKAAIKNTPGLLEKLGQTARDPLVDTPVLTAKIKLLWQCNLDCIFCRRPSPGKYLPGETLHKILDDLCRNGLKKIHFSGGEIFLHPQIEDILRDACGRGLQVNLTSNGTILNREWIKKLGDIGVHSVSISLDAAHARIHDRIRGCKGAFRKTMKSIQLLAQKEKHPKLRINTVACRANAGEFDALAELIRSLGKGVRWHILAVDSSDKKMRLTVSMVRELSQKAEKWNLFDQNPFGRSAEEYRMIAKGNNSCDFYRTRRCYMPWLNVFIDPDGMVFPCCMTRGVEEPLGRMPQQSYTAISRSLASRTLKIRMASGLPLTTCMRCDDYFFENAVIQKMILNLNEAD